MNWFSFFAPQVLEFFHSQFNGEIKIVESFGKKAIYVDGAPQSGAEIGPMWKKVIERIKNHELRIKNALILGVGGGNIIKELLENYPNTAIVAVEIDPIMIKLAKKYFDLNLNSPSRIIISDAFSWIKKVSSKKKFDLIVVDLFIGKLNPKESRNAAFLSYLKRLVNKGFILYNSHYQGEKKHDYDKFIITCKSIFKNVKEVFRYPHNRVLLLQ